MRESRFQRTMQLLTCLGTVAMTITSCGFPFDDGPVKDSYTMEKIHGTWTNPQGEPGNFIRFHDQRLEMTGGMAVIEGLVTAYKIAGADRKWTGRWNWENYSPVRLNVSLPDATIAAVKATDQDSLLIRFGKSYEDVANINIDKDPATIVLKRTGGRLPTPTVSKPFVGGKWDTP